MFLPYLKNPFLNKNLAREDFRDLMHGALTRMAGQNKDGRYTDLIAALEPHHRAYADFLGEQDEALAGRYGDTDEVNQVLADFKQFAKKELLVDVPYIFTRTRPNAKAITDFLPKGRKEYNDVSLLTLPTLLKRVADFTKLYENDLGPALASRAAALRQSYKDARQEQGESKGEVQGDSKEEKKLRKAAARQLKLNLLEQVKLHLDTPDEVKALYDPKIFTPPANPEKKAGTQADVT